MKMKGSRKSMFGWTQVIIICLVSILFLLEFHFGEKLDYFKMRIFSELPSINENKNKLINISINNTQNNLPMNSLSRDDMTQKRFEQRRRLLKDTCKFISKSTPLKDIYDGILMYQKTYDFVICAVPKSGGSTLRSHMAAMNEKHTLHGPPRARRFLSFEQIKEKINEERKIMLVRHPLDRLVSAYEDKVNIGDSKDFRGNRERINTVLGRQKGMKIGFMDFLEYKIELSKSKRAFVFIDLHWANYSSLCAPCSMNYDYIMKTETYTDDMHYLKIKFDIEEITAGSKQRKGKKSSKSTDLVSDMKYWQYYLQVEPCVLREILDLVHQDMVMFDYRLPIELENQASLC